MTKEMEPAKICWAVQAAGRRIPGANNCLVQAFSGEILFGRYGIPAELRIGVSKDNANLLSAHAWLESGGKVVLDTLRKNQYVPLPNLQKELP